MRIDSSAIGMESERAYSSTAIRITSFMITDAGQTASDQTGSLPGNQSQSEEQEADQAKDSEDFLSKTMEEMSFKQVFRTSRIRTPEMAQTKKQLTSIRQQCLNYLMDLMFYGIGGLRKRGFGNNRQRMDMGEASPAMAAATLTTSTQSNLKTYTFSRQYYYEETESTTYTTQGTVKCADGREITFNLNLNMSRSFQEYYEQSYAAIQTSMTDPLVINLDGNIAELSDQTFYFDIDGDGELDEINRLTGKSGYLALDKNGDGIINDGTELFGTASGNGFADLAAYDSDGNGFIDEGDEIFSRLKIWTMDEEGNEQLVSLADVGIGAICLQNISTDFTLTGEHNQAKGMIRNTGFFLYENGMAGTIQHVDVAKYNQAV